REQMIQDVEICLKEKGRNKSTKTKPEALCLGFNTLCKNYNVLIAFLSKIAALPCLNKICPGHWIQQINSWLLPHIRILTNLLPKNAPYLLSAPQSKTHPGC